MKAAICYIVHDDHWYLAASLASFKCDAPAFVFISDRPWHGEAGDTSLVEQISAAAGATVVKGSWLSEESQRAACVPRGAAEPRRPSRDDVTREMSDYAERPHGREA